MPSRTYLLKMEALAMDSKDGLDCSRIHWQELGPNLLTSCHSVVYRVECIHSWQVYAFQVAGMLESPSYSNAFAKSVGT